MRANRSRCEPDNNVILFLYLNFLTLGIHVDWGQDQEKVGHIIVASIIEQGFPEARILLETLLCKCDGTYRDDAWLFPGH